MGSVFQLNLLRFVVVLLLLLLLSSQQSKSVDAGAIISDGDHQKKKNRAGASDAGDGTLNGFPIYYRRQIRNRMLLYSNVQCVGENFATDSGSDSSSPTNPYRSCHITNLCFKHGGGNDGDDDNSNLFLYYQSPEEFELQQELLTLQQKHPNNHVTISSLASTLLGSDNNNNNNSENPKKQQLFPMIHVLPAASSDTTKSQQSYYMVDDNVVTILLPYSLLLMQTSSSSPSSLFRYWFSIYNLISIFGYESTHKKLFIILTRDDETEEKEGKKSDTTRSLLLGDSTTFYLKAMGMTDEQFVVVSSVNDLAVKIHGNVDGANDGDDNDAILCSRHTLVSYGLMGMNQGEDEKEATYKVGQGATLWAFRNYMIKNLEGGGTNKNNKFYHRAPVKPPYKVTFFDASSSSSSKQIIIMDTVKKAFDESEVTTVDLSPSSLSPLTFEQQLASVSESFIFVTALDNTNPLLIMLMATFLPRGSTLIVYRDISSQQQQQQQQQQYQDDVVELFNTAGYFHTYWLDDIQSTKDTTSSQQQQKKLETIIRNKMDRISHATMTS